jgi:phage repressor protein C with HTH and peptisase S24 domain
MHWDEYRQLLLKGEIVKCRPKGNSMKPRIYSGQLITIAPDISKVTAGDIVFCRVSGNYYVHLVTAVDSKGRYQISNNSGHVNGWTKAVYGKVVSVED